MGAQQPNAPEIPEAALRGWSAYRMWSSRTTSAVTTPSRTLLTSFGGRMGTNRPTFGLEPLHIGLQIGNTYPGGALHMH